MRHTFFQQLHKQMTLNNNVFALTGDLGFGGFDQIRKDYPKRFLNCGAAEQAMLDISVGMAYEGKIPVVYSITPFLILRPLETLRTYINHEKLNIKLIGSGRDDNYSHDGFSHFAGDIKGYLDLMPNIKQYWPQTKEEIEPIMNELINNNLPSFLSLERK